MASPPTSSSQALPALGQAFAAYLEATNLYPGLTTIDCAAQGGRLVLLAIHTSPEVDDPRDLLRELEGAFMELMPAVGLPDETWADINAVPVRICLQLQTAQQPYATYTFTWRFEDAARTVFPPAPIPGEPSRPEVAAEANPEDHRVSLTASSPAARANGVTPDPTSAIPVGAMAGDYESLALGSVSGVSVPGADVSGAADGNGNGHWPRTNGAGDRSFMPGSHHVSEDHQHTRAFSDTAIALPDASIERPNNLAWLRGGWNLTLEQLRALSEYWIYGLAGLIVLGSGLFAYALSRPCVVGSCERLTDAEAFYDDAQAHLAGDPDGEAMATAQTDLQAAIDLVEPIPHWSSYYGTAQSNLQQYQSDVTALNALIRSKDVALQAATLSQNPPHPVQRWVDVQLLWQQAIDQLETIPEASPAFNYAQEKLDEYRANHKAIGHRIVAEEEAEANFSTAIQTGYLAQQRMETAESLAGWQLAAKEWQAAIKGLSLIPQGTTAYGEAQRYLKDYNQHLARTSTRANLEENSTRFYQQAVQAAREAKAYEAKSQWTLAVTLWQRAVTSAQKISTESTLGPEAIVLLEIYQPALTNAQNRLRTAVVLQNLTQTVGAMCAGSATPCTVAEDPSQIQITLSSQYAEPLRLAITPPSADGTFAFTNQLAKPVQELIEQIITISHQVDRQVAIYDSHGGFVARYRPDLGGFIKN